MSSSLSSNTRACQEVWPEPAEASTKTPPLGPPEPVQPVYTIVNTIVALRACLDDIARETTIPPKLYSQAHVFPRTNHLYARTQTQVGSLSTPASIPAPLFRLPESRPEIYLDAEGISLSRNGELSILILHIGTAKFSKTYLLHVHVIGRRSFITKTTNGLHTLKSLLEDNRLPKVLFDCRMDSDALFGQFGVLLGGVIDMQFMCLAAHDGGSKYLPGLGKCLSEDLRMTTEEQEWVDGAKARGQIIWRPKCGGRMERFNDDPLHRDIVDYCVVDAAYLPLLFDTYNAALGNRVSLATVHSLWPKHGCRQTDERALNWVARILSASMARVKRALDPNFGGGTGRNPWWEGDDDDWD